MSSENEEVKKSVKNRQDKLMSLKVDKPQGNFRTACSKQPSGSEHYTNLSNYELLMDYVFDCMTDFGFHNVMVTIILIYCIIILYLHVY